MLAEKQLDLNVRVRANAGRIECDERRLSASLHHLLSNSINFTPAGGRVMVLAEGSREGVRITVSDSGIGIAPEQRSEERRVGKECVSKCRSRWSRYH